MTELFYFSGTGNSLHVARELARRLPDARLTPMLSLLDEREITSQAHTVGLVFPIYAFSLPWIVEVFLRRLHLRPDQYLFACASRLCSERVFRRIERLLPENRVTLQGRFAVAMPENYIPVFNIDPPEVRQDMERKLGINAEDFVRRIRNRETVHMSDGWWRLLTWTIFPLLTMIYRLTGFFRLARRLYADERCTVCGQCARLCLAERISMDTGRPRWDTDRVCYHCLACLHFCPQEAIQIRRTKSAQRKRYHHRAVSAAEITAQKGH